MARTSERLEHLHSQMRGFSLLEEASSAVVCLSLFPDLSSSVLSVMTIRKIGYRSENVHLPPLRKVTISQQYIVDNPY